LSNFELGNVHNDISTAIGESTHFLNKNIFFQVVYFSRVGIPKASFFLVLVVSV